MTEEHLAVRLHHQVQDASKGHDFHQVTTIITRAMWRAYLRGTGRPETDEPNQSPNVHQSRRVAGSHTIVVDQPGMWAVSCLTQKP